MTSNAIAGYTLGEIGRRPKKQDEQPDGYTPRDYTHGAFKDRGCKEAPSCLSCHLPVCIHDLYDGHPGIKAKQKAIARHIKSAAYKRHAVVNHAIESGLTVRQAAELCGVSNRTALRALRSGAM